MTRGPVFRHLVVRYLVNNPNRIVFTNDISDYVTTCGITVEDKQIAACIANLRRSNESLYNQIEVLVAGRSYRYRETVGVPLGANPAAAQFFGDDHDYGSDVAAPAEPVAPPTPELVPEPIPEPEPEPEPPRPVELAPEPEPEPEPIQAPEWQPTRPSPAAVAALVRAKKTKNAPVRLASADVPRTFTEIGLNDVTHEVIVMDDRGTLYRLSPLMNENGN